MGVKEALENTYAMSGDVYVPSITQLIYMCKSEGSDKVTHWLFLYKDLSNSAPVSFELRGEELISFLKAAISADNETAKEDIKSIKAAKSFCRHFERAKLNPSIPKDEFENLLAQVEGTGASKA